MCTVNNAFLKNLVNTTEKCTQLVSLNLKSKDHQK